MVSACGCRREGRGGRLVCAVRLGRAGGTRLFVLEFLFGEVFALPCGFFAAEGELGVVEGFFLARGLGWGGRWALMRGWVRLKKREGARTEGDVGRVDDAGEDGLARGHGPAPAPACGGPCAGGDGERGGRAAVVVHVDVLVFGLGGEGGVVGLDGWEGELVTEERQIGEG